MAAQAGSSSAAQEDPFVENEEELIFGAESGWVEARTFCDHLPSLSSDLAHIPTPDTPCNRFIFLKAVTFLFSVFQCCSKLSQFSI
ncbi:histone deacetylase 6 [Prunus yedoensis var. nudiflora]|uniref:Histone deacetylase 6 n=1 Tax=Prunus yedoensis var. nudiflora TaxID=2094558 RepID=A0A314ZKB5_PRUYE|nr:histone deacetylase 6 [Prunus yedoensis var. nudiflora]